MTKREFGDTRSMSVRAPHSGSSRRVIRRAADCRWLATTEVLTSSDSVQALRDTSLREARVRHPTSAPSPHPDGRDPADARSALHRGQCTAPSRHRIPNRIDPMAKPELMDFDKALELFEPVLGFEVHVELSTQTKMFSDAPNPAAAGAPASAPPNTTITPVDLGLPGSLPVVNEKAVEYAISLGLALGCEIAPQVHVLPQELLLPRPRQELPDQPVRRADRVRGLRRDRARGRHAHQRPDRARAHGGGRRQAHPPRRRNRPHPGRRRIPRRLQPRGRAAGRDRDEADLRHRAQGSGCRQGLRGDDPRHRARPRHQRGAHGARQPPLRRERRACAPAGRRSSAPAPRPRT